MEPAGQGSSRVRSGDAHGVGAKKQVQSIGRPGPAAYILCTLG